MVYTYNTMRIFKRGFCRWEFILLFFSIIFCNCKSVPENNAISETDLAMPVMDEPAAAGDEASWLEPAAGQIQGAQPQSAAYGDLLDIVWQLSEIRISYGKTVFDRQAMAENGMGDIYTLQLTEEGLNGKAAPNLYRTSYELRYNHDFRLRTIVGTLMAPNINIGGIMESEYYWYLQQTIHWEIINNGLELYAYPSQNEEIVMRYIRQ